jgi:hypothetical protein
MTKANGASCRDWSLLPVLAIHSVTPPNEEVAKINRTAFTRENMPKRQAEFKIILSLFFVINAKAFGVQNGVQTTVFEMASR